MLCIRDVVGADRPAIISIIERAGNLTEEERGCALELLDIYLNGGQDKDYFFVAAAGGDGLPAGYVCYGRATLTRGTYDIYWILVDPESMGKGIGTALLGHVEALLKKAGARLMVAETSGLPSYERARLFYLRCGFREEARVRDFFNAGDDKVIYVKDVSDAAIGGR
ncbi:MAG: GNAT family N-acetyltransferase [Deltaproteobacteria bacterium]|nr:GNAT family N-acetyltransferase [Deltaproteobacteria bacterium]